MSVGGGRFMVTGSFERGTTDSCGPQQECRKHPNPYHDLQSCQIPHPLEPLSLLKFGLFEPLAPHPKPQSGRRINQTPFLKRLYHGLDWGLMPTKCNFEQLLV